MSPLNVVRLDASTACQLRCPSCPTAAGTIGRQLGSTLLSARDFSEFLNKNPLIKYIELSNWGEIFLNPEITEILRIGFERGVALSCYNGANLNSVAPGVCEALVRYQLRGLRCSIDGATQETYVKYRVRGDFERVIENIREINKHKASNRSCFPKLQWQYIVFKHNVHEIAKARSLAEQLDMTFELKLDWDDLYGRSFQDEWEPPQSVIDELGYASRKDFARDLGRPYLQKLTCSQLWLDPQINADGRVLGCCVNHWGDFGNAFTSSVDSVYNGTSMNYARQMLMGKVEPRSDIPCSSCSHFDAIRQSGEWMSEKDILLQRIARKAPRLTRWALSKLGLSDWLR